MKSVHLVFAVVASLTAASVASAQTTTYNSEATFLANVAPGAYTEGFSDPFFSGDPSANFSFGGFSYTVSAPSGLYGNGTFIGTNLPAENLLVTFTGAPVTALGGFFYATNINDAFQAATISLLLSDGTTSMFTPASPNDAFRGFTTTQSITSLTVASTPGVYVGFDNLTVGTAVSVVPEPSAVLLVGMGLGGLALARRRKHTV